MSWEGNTWPPKLRRLLLRDGVTVEGVRRSLSLVGSELLRLHLQLLLELGNESRLVGNGRKLRCRCVGVLKVRSRQLRCCSAAALLKEDLKEIHDVVGSWRLISDWMEQRLDVSLEERGSLRRPRSLEWGVQKRKLHLVGSRG
jgi:hypothetical protein